MANIVLGVATPHAPQLRLPLEGWYALQEKDQTDKRINFEELRRGVEVNMEKELSDDRIRERYDTAQTNLRSLSAVLEKADADAIVMIGDDQHEQFHSDNMPMFSIYHGDTINLVHRHGGGRQTAGSQSWNAPRLDQLQSAVEAELVGPRERPAERSLAEHLIGNLRDEEFDVASSDSLRPDVGIGHAFKFFYELMLPGSEIPVVPVMVNTFFPPNQPTPARCYRLGQMLRSAVEVWDSDKRVVIMASGGLSHTIIDEDIDRRTISGIAKGDAQALKTLPRERLNLGTSEIRNWITAAGAMEPMTPHFIGDYIPGYRSVAGTGCGMAFAYWD